MTCISVSIPPEPAPDIYIHTIGVNDEYEDSVYTATVNVSARLCISIRNRGNVAGSRIYKIITKNASGSVVDTKIYQTPTIPARTTIDGEYIARFAWQNAKIGEYTICVEVV